VQERGSWGFWASLGKSEASSPQAGQASDPPTPKKKKKRKKENSEADILNSSSCGRVPERAAASTRRALRTKSAPCSAAPAISRRQRRSSVSRSRGSPARRHDGGTPPCPRFLRNSGPRPIPRELRFGRFRAIAVLFGVVSDLRRHGEERFFA
jgi:hypothetical protein